MKNRYISELHHKIYSHGEEANENLYEKKAEFMKYISTFKELTTWKPQRPMGATLDETLYL